MGSSDFVPDDVLPDLRDTVIDSVVERLADAGLSTEMIAYAVDSPTHHIRAVVRRTSPTGDALDEKLTKEVSRLAQMALKEAFLILEFGPSEQKMSIIKSVVGGLTRQATAGETSGAEEIRVAFDQFLADQKDVPELTTIVTDSSFVDAQVIPSPQDAYDQDEGP